MPARRKIARLAGRALICCALLGGCANQETSQAGTSKRDDAHAAQEQEEFLNRLTWGASPSAAEKLAQMGMPSYLNHQLHPGPLVLPPAIAEEVKALTISQKPMDALVLELEAQRKSADALADPDQKKAAQQAYRQEQDRIGREAQTRSLLYAVYSPNQLEEQMTWFWMNHFNVHMYKSNIRLLVGDYEEHAIRPHALGHFRDLLDATLHHPAMLRYLDNEQNALGHINENYAREIMELHTLGVHGGYSQHDVQELARILTGVGVNMGPNTPKLTAQQMPLYRRAGLFEFSPARHDFGDKEFLGKHIKGRGMDEVEEAVTLLARSPATAEFVSRKIAVYFESDNPPEALVHRMAETFTRTDGDIAAVLQTLFESREFNASLASKFKDPVHYVVSAVRLAYDEKPILNTQPMVNWLNRMNEPLFAHETPDGYPMTEGAWASSGQMTTRFEIAKAIGSGSAGLFKTDGPQPIEQAAFPQLSNALYYNAIQKTLGPATRSALDQATSPQEWNTFLLASPEFMTR
jgi:uncharacterized protein (DUF1800 family)